ncbi:nicotinate-nucleotide--dimethylbenzimidazole phosphoribosyltransferase [Kineococcus esterisolvens]|uniref:nicotinate-nucleotide--dimethylbenzimidazole phosphoribosyltransferase n=1 Tax=Kineococcus sp. SYSU DK030 TaxID=3383151 RepID=UPI003D7E603D
MTDGPRPLNLREVAEGLRSPHAPAAPAALAGAGGARSALLAPGRLRELATWLAGTRDTDVAGPLERARLVVLAGDHGVAARGVSVLAPDGTADAVRDLVAGTHPAAALAAAAAVELAVHAVGVRSAGPDGDRGAGGLPAAVTARAVRAGSGDVAREDAMSAEETAAAVRAGAAIADEAADEGVQLLLLGDVGVGATTVAATLVAACLRKSAVDVVGRGSGVDDDAWMRKTAAVRDAVRRARPVATRPGVLLQTVGSPDTAAAVGFLLRAAARRTPVVLDGVVGAAAALVAARGVPGAEKWWLAGARTAEPAQHLALERLKLTPVLDLGAGRGAGTGALAALGVLRAAQVLASADAAAAPVPEPEPEPEPEHESVPVADGQAAPGQPEGERTAG